MEREYNKLVRDNIPEIIESEGNTPIMRVLDMEDYKICLFEKLKEEVFEFQADESIEELSDVLEVIDALKAVLKYSDDLIEEVKAQKAKKNGKFQKRLFLEKVITNEI